MNAFHPFDLRTLAFIHELSRTLASDPILRKNGAVQALAYWLRPTETRKLEQHFRALEGSDTVLVPRGRVFHIPPSNVDTLFVYSWILSLLVGNENVVRLSNRLSGVGSRIASLVQRVLEEPAHSQVSAASQFVSYGHDDAQTATLSANCDMRVLWGGDVAVSSLRQIPIPPHAIDLVFPDRYSACALSAHAFLALDSADRDVLADRFAIDAFWFDQNACASPRLVVWVGTQEEVAGVSTDFWVRVAAAARRRSINSEPSTVLNKITVAARCVLDEGASRIERHSPEVTVIKLDSPHELQRVTPGGGLFHEIALPTLSSIGPLLKRRDQTLTTFGFNSAELLEAVRKFNGRGIDRIVPVGQALAFHYVWDGYDLMQQFTRRVSVSV